MSTLVSVPVILTNDKTGLWFHSFEFRATPITNPAHPPEIDQSAIHHYKHIELAIFTNRKKYF